MKLFYFNSLSKNIFSLKKSSSKVSQKRLLSLGIIGAQTSAGQPKQGVELGPKAIRSAGLLQSIERLGHNVIDFGDFSFDSKENFDNFEQKSGNKVRNEAQVRYMCDRLSSLVGEVTKANRIPIMIGGDHSSATASISANAQKEKDMCVIWVDAHADINTVQTTKSGNFHGMAVSFLIKQIKEMFDNPNNGCLPINPCIDAKNFGFIGLRDVESSELDLIRKTNITYFTTEDIDKLGINEVIARTLDQINPQLKRRIHVSFDIDAIDPLWAPSTGTPVTGGLTLREGLRIGEEISATNLLCGLDLVEVNPSIGSQTQVNNTINSSLNIMLSFLGKPRIGLH